MPVAKSTSNFEPAPQGTHIARCYGCISLGTQHSDMYADKFKVMLMFELPNEMIEFDDNGTKVQRPMTIQKEYGLSLGKKSTLRKHLESWRGRAFTDEELKGFEVSNVVGAPCQITIVHVPRSTGDGVSARIESVTGLSKGTSCPPQVHKAVKFEIEEGRMGTYKELPEWIRTKIEACEEWQSKNDKAPGSTAPIAANFEPVDDDGDPSVPF